MSAGHPLRLQGPGWGTVPAVTDDGRNPVDGKVRALCKHLFHCQRYQSIHRISTTGGPPS